MTSTANTDFIEQPLDCLDRAVTYGDGIFETVAVFDGTPPLWACHRQRLVSSVSRLGMAVDVAVIQDKVLAMASQAGNAVLRIIVARSGGKRGYDPRYAAGYVFSIESFPLPAYPLSLLQSGVALHLCHHVLPRNPALAGIKHLNRLDQVMAAGEWNRSLEQEGLVLDDTGAVTEGTISNLFIVKNGILHTPTVQYCGVAGVMREFIISVIAPALSLNVVIQRLTLADVLVADECFVCNSIFGVWPVSRLGVAHIGTQRSVTEKIQRMVSETGYNNVYA